MVSGCQSGTRSIQGEAQQIVDERQHIAAVETMTALLQQGQVVEGTATGAAIDGQ
jgi:hypothetical protein